MLAHFDIHLFLHGPLNNYGMLVHSRDTGQTAAIDCGDASETFAALEKTGWDLTEIWATHHHPDHTAGVKEVKAKTGCYVRGPEQGRSLPISDLDIEYWDGDHFEFAGRPVDIIATPGHTLDMINYHLPDQKVVFTGDTLFTLGCGRIFDGSPALLQQSLERLMALPADTLLFGAHEYTRTNIAFTRHVDPENVAVRERIARFEKLLEKGDPTVPVKLAGELATNPFLRADDPGIRATLGLQDATDAEVFARLRQIRNEF